MKHIKLSILKAAEKAVGFCPKRIRNDVMMSVKIL
jgi:hypothetical protein